VSEHELRQRNLARLETEYFDGPVILALGAGVSQGSGLPTWHEILERLAERRWPSEGQAILAALFRSGYSLPAVAGILEGSCSSAEEFTLWLREEIYHGFPFYRTELTRENQAAFLNHMNSNKTLGAVAAFCVAKAGPDYIRNPNVQAVFNFNFDALFREFVHHRFGNSILRTIDRPSAGAMSARIPVYHMHGYLQFDSRKIGDLTSEAPDVRVLTEHEYFDFFNRSTTIYNYSFLHHLREASCVFIGLSMRDDNIRRLLHYSRRERVESDLREGHALAQAEHNSIRHYALLKQSVARIDALTELTLKRLGVRVIWYSDHELIPAILRSVYQSRGEWSDVYDQGGQTDKPN